jgi:hypothetical protein
MHRLNTIGVNDTDRLGTTDEATEATTTTNYNLSLLDEVQALVATTSEKYVMHVGWEEITIDAFACLKQFWDAVRYKEWHRLNPNNPNNPRRQQLMRDTTDRLDQLQSEEEALQHFQGLSTNQRPIKTTSDAPMGTPQLEAFLRDLEEEILSQLWTMRERKPFLDPKSQQIKNLLLRLRETPKEHQENVWDVSSGEACLHCVGKKPGSRVVFFQSWFPFSR